MKNRPRSGQRARLGFAVRGSADLGSRPRNVTEHAAAIEEREPQPQPCAVVECREVPARREAISCIPHAFCAPDLDAFGVILEALRLGDAIARELPRGYGKLSEQLRRALLGAYLQFTEGAARDGADRNSRLRCARAEAGESAAALEAAVVLGLASGEVGPVIVLLDRFCAMVTRLGGLGSRWARRRGCALGGAQPQTRKLAAFAPRRTTSRYSVR